MSVRNLLTKKRIIFAALAAFLIVLAVWRFVYRGNGKESKSSAVKRGDVREQIVLSGKIDATERAALQFQTSGLMTWVGVKEGDYAQKYQAMASLDIRTLKKNLEKELNDYKKARNDRDQNDDTYKNQIISDQIKRIVEKSQADLNNTVLDVEISDLALKLAILTSPIEGIVTRAAYPYGGVNISAGQNLFEIVNPKTIYFDAGADQTEVVSLHQGDSAEIVLDAYPEEKIKGVVAYIGFASKTEETGTVYRLKINFFSLPEALFRYRLGMTGDVYFTTRSASDVLFVEPKYLKSDSRGKYLLSGKSRDKIYVETGLESDNKIEIRGALKEGDLVYD